ncbi:DUF481 domain-containing protein [Sphingomicrobium sp. XHP0235]|uniref:DUF481 domain-containing protein n=1 Tax=Sphingomicrobium aquimarinum TaxID=3133971 RepID=UPI0031FEBA19
MTTTMLLAAAMAGAQPAEPLPDAVQTLIAQAGETGDAAKLGAVVEMARAAYPGHDARLAELEAAAMARIGERNTLAQAQAEEALREASMFGGWAGQGELGGFYATGSTEEAGATAGVKLVREGIDWRHKLNGHADWRRSDGDTTREQLRAGYEANYDLGDTFYTYGLAAIERDRLQGIDNRISLSGGAGARLIERETMTLDIKAGPAWRRTDRTDGTVTQRIAGLAAATFAWQITERLALTEDVDIYLDDSNSTFLGETGLQADLGGNLLARLALRIEHESDPPLGREATDTLTRFTLVYDFE